MTAATQRDMRAKKEEVAREQDYWAAEGDLPAMPAY